MEGQENSNKQDQEEEKKQKARLAGGQRKKAEGTTEHAWGLEKTDKQYGFKAFFAFVGPIVWKGGWLLRIQALITFIMVILCKVLTVFSPIMLKYAIDGIVACTPTPAAATTGPVAEVVPATGTTGLVTPLNCNATATMIYIVLYCAVRFASDLFNNLKDVVFANVSATSEVAIASAVYNHVQGQCLAFHLSRETGKIIRIVSKGSQSFSQILRYSLFNILPILLEIVFTLIVLASLFPWAFFLGVLITVLLYFIFTYVLTEWRAKYFKDMNNKDNSVVQKATDALLNFETVKYFNAEAHEEDRYQTALSTYKTANIKVARSLVALNLAQSLIINLGLVINLYIAYSMIVNGTLQVGDFVMVNQYIIQIYQPLNILGSFWRWIRQAMVDVEQIFELMDVDEKIEDPVYPRPLTIAQGKGEIVFENVSFTYDKTKGKPNSEKQYIIENLNLTIPAGKSVALVGSTGSGKSTIMRLLYRFYDIDEGKILIDGQDITTCTISNLRSHIAIVPQDCVLFNDTLRYNIAYGGIGS